MLYSRLKFFKLVLLSIVLFSKQLSSINIGVKAEWNDPKIIIMHTPQREILYGLLHANAALYEKAFNSYKAQQEHIEYISQLEGCGAKVIQVVDVLLEGTVDKNGNKVKGTALNNLIDFASKSLLYNFPRSWETKERKEQDRYKKESLKKLHPRDLVNIIFERPIVNLAKSNEKNTKFVVKGYIASPVMNMHFLRDQQITTDKGIVMAKMNSMQRSHEVDITEFVFKKLGINPIYKVTGEGRLEGGDYIPCGDFALIGQGLRTNAEGIRQLLENKVFGFKEIAVVKDPFMHQDQMHLDTYFNIMGPKKALVNKIRRQRGIITKDDISRPIRPTVDIYKKLENGDYKLSRKDVDFFDYIEKEKQFKIMDIENYEQLNYGCNFLCVGENKIIGVRNVSDTYLNRLTDFGINAKLIKFRNITKSYGGPHCTTQVIYRKNSN